MTRFQRSLATWVMTRCCRESSELLGDILEEYEKGRSNAWLWRQVISAVVLTTVAYIRTNSALLIAAAATGTLVLPAAQYVATLLLAPAVPYNEFPSLWVGGAVIGVRSFLAATVTGWLVAGVARRHERTAATLFAAVYCAVALPWSVAVSSLLDPIAARAHLVIQGAAIGTTVIGLWCGARPRRHQTSCVAVFLVAMLTATAVAAGQQAPTTNPLSFAVASIKRNPSADATGSRIGPQPGGGFVMTNGTVQSLLFLAFDLANYNGLSGAPEWVMTDRYDVTARLDTTNAPAALDETRMRLRALLSERFKLVAHEELREQPTYALVTRETGGAATTGLRLSKSDCSARRAAAARGTPMPPAPATGSVPPCNLQARGDSIRSGGVTMTALARTLTGLVGRIVVDKTGLAGDYEFELAFESPSLSGADPLSKGPSIFTALEQQLGLRLVSERNRVPVLVIDHIERPTPD